MGQQLETNTDIEVHVGFFQEMPPLSTTYYVHSTTPDLTAKSTRLTFNYIKTKDTQE
jgi:hypothetical protein